MTGYNFTERVRKALALARNEAMAIAHAHVSTEHILLGLLREGDGVACTVLRNLDIDAKEVQRRILETAQRGPTGVFSGPDLPYTSSAKKVLELAMAAARELNHAYVGTEHVLLGLIDQREGKAAQVLATFDLGPDRARAEIVRIVGPGTASGDPTASEAKRSFGDRIKSRIFRNSVGARTGFNFTTRLRRALSEARGIAAELKHEYVGTEHILLSIIRESEVAAQPQGTAIQALNRCGVDIGALRQAVLSAIKPGNSNGTRNDVPYTSRAKQSLELAFSEARMRGHAHVGTEHLLLGLLREENGIAAKAMESQGLTLSGLRAAVEGIGGRSTGEIETDGANLVVTDLSEGMSGTSSKAFAKVYHDEPEYPERIAAIIASAQQIAGELGMPTVDAIHLALALVQSKEGAAHALLELSRCDREALHKDVERVAEEGRAKVEPEQHVELGDEAQRVLARMEREQRAAGRRTAATDHLLVAVLDERPEIAVLFARHNVTAEGLRELARRVRG